MLHYIPIKQQSETIEF